MTKYTYKIGDLLTSAELKNLPDGTKISYRGFSVTNGHITDGKFVFEKKPIDGRLYEIREFPQSAFKVGDTIRFYDVRRNIPKGSLLVQGVEKYDTYLVEENGLHQQNGRFYPWNKVISGGEPTIVYLPESK